MGVERKQVSSWQNYRLVLKILKRYATEGKNCNFMSNRYIRQLNIRLETADSVMLERTEQIIDFLKQQGVAVQVAAGIQILNAEIEVPEEICKSISMKGILWLTDSEHFADKLAALQLPVIVWLHEGNRRSNFQNIRYAVEDPQELDGDFFDRVYRRYAGIPWDIAETARCLIRETTVEDAEAFAGIYEEPAITRYMDPFCSKVRMEREYVKEYMEKVYDFYGYGVWTVVYKETGEVIGRVGFGQEEIPALGYMIALPWQGHGLAQEVCRAVLAFAKEELGFEQVQALIHENNLPSIRVAEKIGFSRQQSLEEADSKNIRFTLKM